MAFEQDQASSSRSSLIRFEIEDFSSENDDQQPQVAHHSRWQFKSGESGNHTVAGAEADIYTACDNEQAASSLNLNQREDEPDKPHDELKLEKPSGEEERPEADVYTAFDYDEIDRIYKRLQEVKRLYESCLDFNPQEESSCQSDLTDEELFAQLGISIAPRSSFLVFSDNFMGVEMDKTNPFNVAKEPTIPDWVTHPKTMSDFLRKAAFEGNLGEVMNLAKYVTDKIALSVALDQVCLWLAALLVILSINLIIYSQ